MSITISALQDKLNACRRQLHYRQEQAAYHAKELQEYRDLITTDLQEIEQLEQAITLLDGIGRIAVAEHVAKQENAQAKEEGA